MERLDLKNIDKIVDLIESYLSGEISEQDKDRLLNWVCESEANLTLFDKIINDYSSAELLEKQFNEIDSIDGDFMESVFIDCIRADEGSISFYQRYKQLIFTAASILFVIVSGWFFYINDLKNQPSTPADLAKLFTTLSNQASPAKWRTAIRIGRDAPVVFEEIQDTIIFTNQSIQFAKGDLIRDLSEIDPNTYIFLETPYNSKVVAQLSDGSIVDVHPGSSLRFQKTFSSSERLVSLAGEAFFHVEKKIDKQPFKVQIINDQINGFPQVKVLGTSFWVSSLQEFASFEAGVLKGVIEVSHENRKETLVPGKSIYASQGKIETREFKVEDLSPRMKGLLSWSNHEIGDIIRKISHWYNIDVDFDEEFDLKRKFTIRLDPAQEISEVIKILNYIGINTKFDSTVYPNKLFIIN